MDNWFAIRSNARCLVGFFANDRPRGDAPGYGVYGRWPIEPVAMFDGPMRYPVFFAKGDTHHSLGQRPRSGYGVLGRWPIEPVVMFDGANATPGFFRQRRYSS